MKIFKIKFSSSRVFGVVVLLLGSLTAVVALYLNHEDASTYWYFIFSILGLASFVYLPGLPSTALTQWTFTEQGFEIKWLTQFLFYKKPDTFILWGEISKYKYLPARNYDSFKLEFRNGTHLLFLRNEFTPGIDDDNGFTEFLNYFEQQVVIYNQNHEGSPTTIVRRKNIYETTTGLVLAVLLVLSLLAIPFLWLLHPEKEINLSPPIFAFGTSLYVVGKVIYYRRKGRREKLKNIV